MQPDVTLIDYGIGNLYSVRHALEHIGARVTISSQASEISQSRCLILPGVGAFASGMGKLEDDGLDNAIVSAVHNGSTLLGICLGMQLLFDSSEEFGATKGLGLLPGKVMAIPESGNDGLAIKVPHIGWSDLTMPSDRQDWDKSPLEGANEHSAVYFVHSYMACPDKPAHRIADCQYGDLSIAALVGHGKVWGAQFHPERSGQIGLNILKQFVQLSLSDHNETIGKAA